LSLIAIETVAEVSAVGWESEPHETGKMVSQDFEVRGVFYSFFRFFTFSCSQVKFISSAARGKVGVRLVFPDKFPPEFAFPPQKSDEKLRLRFNVDSTLDTCDMGSKAEVGTRTAATLISQC